MNLVVVQGNTYTAFQDKTEVCAIRCTEMTPEFLEYYRKFPLKVYQEMADDDDNNGGNDAA